VQPSRDLAPTARGGVLLGLVTVSGFFSSLPFRLLPDSIASSLVRPLANKPGKGGNELEGERARSESTAGETAKGRKKP